jgi:hypothetical protein
LPLGLLRLLLALLLHRSHDPCEELRRSIPETLRKVMFRHIEGLSFGIHPPQHDVRMGNASKVTLCL